MDVWEDVPAAKAGVGAGDGLNFTRSALKVWGGREAEGAPFPRHATTD